MSSSVTQTSAEAGPRTRPPFRADQVGSLLRPRELAEARAAHKAGTLSAEALACGGGPLHRSGDPQAGGGRAARRDRWRISARVLALRFRVRPGRRGDLRAGAENPVQGRGVAACSAGERTDWLVEAGDGGSLSVRGGPCADGGAEDDHSVTQRGAFPWRTAGDRPEGVSGPGWILRRSRCGVPEGGGGVRRGRAAAICRSTR